MRLIHSSARRLPDSDDVPITVVVILSLIAIVCLAKLDRALALRSDRSQVQPDCGKPTSSNEQYLPTPMTTERSPSASIHIGDVVRPIGGANLLVVEFVTPAESSAHAKCICRRQADSPTSTGTRLVYPIKQLELVARHN
jgi:hypothetical protein